MKVRVGKVSVCLGVCLAAMRVGGQTPEGERGGSGSPAGVRDPVTRLGEIVVTAPAGRNLPLAPTRESLSLDISLSTVTDEDIRRSKTC